MTRPEQVVAADLVQDRPEQVLLEFLAADLADSRLAHVGERVRGVEVVDPAWNVKPKLVTVYGTSTLTPPSAPITSGSAAKSIAE